MSSCLTLKYPDEIYMCGDSAVSKINSDTGKMIKAADEDCTKIYQFGNYVVFASGIKQIIDSLLIELQKSKENLSFQLISEKTREFVSKFPQINKKFALELTVSTNTGGKLTSCVISSMHDCQVEFKDENKCLIMFNGCKCEKLKEKYLKYCDIAGSIRDLYLNVYREMEKEVEEIGGALTVYKLDKNSINIILRECITPEKFFLHLYQDGSYSEMLPETGFKWHKVTGDTGRDYHYLTAIGSVIMPTNSAGAMSTAIVQLPDEFKNKSFKVSVSIKSVNTASGNARMLYGFSCYAFESDYDLPNAKFKIYASSDFDVETTQNDVSVSYIAIA